MPTSARSLPPAARAALALLAVVALAGIALAWLAGRYSARSAPVAEASPAPVPSGYFRPTAAQWRSFTLATVRTMSFADASRTDGSIAAADDASVPVFSPFTGRVTAVFVTTGDRVARGTPLFAGDSAEYAQAVNDERTADATLSAARVALAVAARNRRHLLALERVDGAARKDVDQTAADVAADVTNVANARTAAALARSHVLLLGERLGGTAASPGRALATHVVVRAPMAGTISQRAVGAGEFVQGTASGGGTTPLLTIVDPARLEFVAAATEAQAPRIHAGDPVTVRIDGLPGRTFSARVAYLAPALDATTHRIAVRADVDDPTASLRPGMFGTFEIETGAPTTAVGVPESAVIFEGDTARVWIAGPDRTLALRELRTGQIVDGLVEVFAGLRAGDRVVTSGSLFIDRAAQGDD